MSNSPFIEREIKLEKHRIKFIKLKTYFLFSFPHSFLFSFALTFHDLIEALVKSLYILDYYLFSFLKRFKLKKEYLWKKNLIVSLTTCPKLRTFSELWEIFPSFQYSLLFPCSNLKVRSSKDHFLNVSLCTPIAPHPLPFFYWCYLIHFLLA